MSSDHLDEAMLSGWRADTLDDDDLVAASDHLAVCARCRRGVAAAPASAVAREVAGQLAEAGDEGRHPSDAEFIRWVDRAADAVDLELFESHLATCPACRAAAQDLAATAATLRRSARRRSVAAWLGVAAVLAVSVTLWWWRAAAQSSAIGSVVDRSRPAPSPVESPMPLVRLADGERTITVDQDGRVRGIPERWRAQVFKLLERPQLVTPVAALAVARSPEALRGAAEAPSLMPIAPLSRVVLEARPTFRWRGSRGSRFRVEVFGLDADRVAASGWLRADSWQAPEDLPRGQVLSWQITAIAADGARTTAPSPPAEEAVFEIASRSAAEEIGAARATGSRLLIGLALWNAGLVEEAAGEFAALAGQNPGSTVARELARSSAAARR